jgi:N-methylhydantoinase A/oxoprolinase/acetone carboxylase beta subunit
VAENLNIDTIYIHQFAGILSAYGISQAKVRAESQESVGAIFTEVLQTETLPKIKQRLLANNC